MPKTGRLSKLDEERMAQWADKYDVVEIARRLDRKIETVQEWLNLNKKVERETPVGFKIAIRQELRETLAWKSLQKEFTKEEIARFEESYLEWMRQFKDDVLASEENQIFDYVKVDILLSRALQRQNRTRAEIEDRRDDIKKMKLKYGDIDSMDKDTRDTIVALQNRVQFLEGAEQSHVNELEKLLKQKGNLAESLKATRDQRINEVDRGSKFIDMIKYFQRRDNQEKESKHMALLKRGTEKEFNRLTTPHQYVDGQVDLPILSAESLDRIDKLEEQDEANLS